jgi:hypothetical protein
MKKSLAYIVLFCLSFATSFASFEVDPDIGTQAQCNAVGQDCDGWDQQVGAPYTVACCCMSGMQAFVCEIVIKNWIKTSWPDWLCYEYVGGGLTSQECIYTPPSFWENYEYIGEENSCQPCSISVPQ